jgi:hypothetical protein
MKKKNEDEETELEKVLEEINQDIVSQKCKINRFDMQRRIYGEKADFQADEITKKRKAQ